MGFIYEKDLPTPQELIRDLPLSDELKKLKKKRDKEIAEVITGINNRLLIILGPCSADHPDTVIDYMKKLSSLQDEVKDNMIIIPRIYTNKPRTKGIGYKGLASEPDPTMKPDIVKGIKEMRKLHIDALTASRLPAADEMLYPENTSYLEDVLGYVAVGARSVENQKHRLTASGIDVPVGMKNPTSGDIQVMFNAIEASHAQHVFAYNNSQTRTTGNKLVHCILRGYEHDGKTRQNYNSDDIFAVINEYKNRGNLGKPCIIIDTNHANSGKDYLKQPKIAKEVLSTMLIYQEIKDAIKGFMIESYFHDGNQKITYGKEYQLGLSITDPCLGLEKTKNMIREINEIYENMRK